MTRSSHIEKADYAKNIRLHTQGFLAMSAVVVSPRLWDIRLDGRMLRDDRVTSLSPLAFKSLMLIVSYCASSMVWTYNAPRDVPMIASGETGAMRISNLTKRKFSVVWEEISEFFEDRDGALVLIEDWVVIREQFRRPLISASLRAEVMNRDGHKCTYCGALDGPFDIDHMIPVSEGGSNDPENLTCACVSCNRSKGAKSLEVWLYG